MLKNIIIAIMMVILLNASAVCVEQKNDVKLAVKAAKVWLEKVDQGQYKESWKEASDYFKNAVSEEKWEDSLNAVRKPLGKMISRQLYSAVTKTSLPGAPDGLYIVIRFETSFENKKKAVETITPMQDADGNWKVSGYFIK